MGRFGQVVDDSGAGGRYPALVCLRTRFGVSEKLSAENKKPYLALLGDLSRRWWISNTELSQIELNLNWPAYIAQLYRAAEELNGINTDAKWEQPPR